QAHPGRGGCLPGGPYGEHPGGGAAHGAEPTPEPDGRRPEGRGGVRALAERLNPVDQSEDRPSLQGGSPSPVSESILTTIRERCPEAETAMAAQVEGALQILLPRFQGLTVTETQVSDLLENLVEGVVSWQLAHSEPWGEAEDARRPAVEVLARAVIDRAGKDVRRVLLGAIRN